MLPRTMPCHFLGSDWSNLQIGSVLKRFIFESVDVASGRERGSAHESARRTPEGRA